MCRPNFHCGCTGVEDIHGPEQVRGCVDSSQFQSICFWKHKLVALQIRLLFAPCRNVGTLGAFGEIYRNAGGGFPGIAAFWAGTGPKVCPFASSTCKCRLLGGPGTQRDGPPSYVLCCLQMVESASKGAILMYSKEAILKVLSTGDINPGMCLLCIAPPCPAGGGIDSELGGTGGHDESSIYSSLKLTLRMISPFER